MLFQNEQEGQWAIVSFIQPPSSLKGKFYHDLQFSALLPFGDRFYTFLQFILFKFSVTWLSFYEHRVFFSLNSQHVQRRKVPVRTLENSSLRVDLAQNTL